MVKEEDYAALIYQDTMRMRAEAAAIAKVAAAKSSESRPIRTSPRLMLMDNDGSTKSEVKEAPKKKRKSTDDSDTGHSAQKQKRRKKMCSADSCNEVKGTGGVC